MEYNRIIAITGMGGLYELLSSRGDGAVVKSLEDKQTKFVSSRIHHFSHLESIEVYTVKENVNLLDLFKAIRASGADLPGDHEPEKVRGFFEKVYPDMDFTRIYNSDMKKMIKWYNLLISNNIELKLPEPEAAPAEGTAPTAEAAPRESPAPAEAAASTSKAAPKKDSPKKEAPKKDAPKKDAPKKDAPKKEAPKKDAAKKKSK